LSDAVETNETWNPPRRFGVGAIVTAALIGLLVFEVVRTVPVRGAVQSFAELVTAAHGQDLATAEALCTRRYLESHHLQLAEEGGIVGLPRNLNKNFQAWREGEEVHICPTNRVGPVYRFVREGDDWKFDGPVGLLLPDGEVLPMEELPDDVAAPDPE
jgi:hypothetical protein